MPYPLAGAAGSAQGHYFTISKKKCGKQLLIFSERTLENTIEL